MKKIILITGGQRSGKSTYAEQLALSLTENPIYIATAHVWDDEFRNRVEKHKERRGSEWTNIEEEKYLSNHKYQGRTILIDCLTLWSTNFFFENKSDVNLSLSQLKKEFDDFTNQDDTFIFVTNEIGCGGVSDNEIQRKCTDLLGWTNQYVVSKADEVYCMISGIALKIK